MPGYQPSPLPCSAFSWGADFVGPIVIVDVGVVRTAADNGQNSGHAIRLAAARHSFRAHAMPCPLYWALHSPALGY
jgi:hypothetical protein